MIKLKLIKQEVVEEIHNKCIERFGGSLGILNKDTLINCLHTHSHTYDKVDLYPTILDKISITCYCLIKNHPFRDGNKRTGVLVMLGLCRKNGLTVKVSQQELVQFALDVATGELPKEKVKTWLQEHIVN